MNANIFGVIQHGQPRNNPAGTDSSASCRGGGRGNYGEGVNFEWIYFTLFLYTVYYLEPKSGYRFKFDQFSLETWFTLHLFIPLGCST